MDFTLLKEQVKYNCNVSDARYWGYFSICGLLLRMRELYRSEHSMPFYEPIPMEVISPWIEKRDRLWREMEGAELSNIGIGGSHYTPFDAEGINDKIADRGLIYGAGFGRHMKPNFFLADLVKKTVTDQYVIYEAGDEHVRDIDTVPAMVQGADIFIRSNRIKGLVWERFYEMCSKKYAGLLDMAFANYNIDRTEKPSEQLDEKIDEAVIDVSEIIISHEVGEVLEDKGIEGWLEILSMFNAQKEEYILRAIKDVLADCSEHGPIKEIVMQRDEGKLAFYAALLTGLYKAIFPEAISELQGFIDSKDWEGVERMRIKGYERFKSYRDSVLEAWKGPDGKDGVTKILNGLMT